MDCLDAELVCFTGALEPHGRHELVFVCADGEQVGLRVSAEDLAFLRERIAAYLDGEATAGGI